MGNEIENDIGDFDVSDEQTQDIETQADTQADTAVDATEGQTLPDDGSISMSKEEYESVKGFAEEYAREKALSATVDAIKKDYSDFDQTKVIEKIQEIAKTDLAKAQSYNNEVGFRALWLEMSRNIASNDPVNGGSSKGGANNDFQSALDDALQGKEGASKRAYMLSQA